MIAVTDAAALSIAFLQTRSTLGGDVRVGLSTNGTVVVELDPGTADVLAHLVSIGAGRADTADTVEAFAGVVADVIAMADRADQPPRLSLVSGYLPPKGHRP